MEEFIVWAEMVYDEMAESMKPISFGNWKREVEQYTGEPLEPIEATTLFDFVSGRGF